MIGISLWIWFGIAAVLAILVISAIGFAFPIWYGYGGAPAKSVGSAHDRSDCFGLKGVESAPVYFGQGNEFCSSLEKNGERDKCDKAIAYHSDKWYRCESKSCNSANFQCDAKDPGGRTGWYECIGPKEGVKACKDTPVCSKKNCNAKDFCDAAADCCLDYNASDCAKCVVAKCENP